MDSSGFSAPRSDCFPAGLRVLVVDDDPTWLKILEKMLKKCNYEVMTCNLAREALDLLRERKDGFDIVISDVNMPDMDGFKLLEHVGLEMDLPVIMMSVDGETSRVMKGVQHGACDYLLKPIRMKELRNIWQHVLRKRMHEVRDIEGHESFEEYQLLRNGTEQSDESYSFSGDLISGKKRKDDSKHDDKVCGDPSSVKKARVIWTVDLHQKFVKAVNQIGLSKVGPKKILDLMGVPWLTRENVASHLQKYRLYLTRLQKENELKVTFGGINHSDISPKDTAGDVCLQNLSTQDPITTQQNMVTNESFVVSVHKNPIQDSDNNISDGNVKGLFSIPVAASKKPLLGDMNESLKSSTSRISFNTSFGPIDSDIKSQLKIQAKYSWNADVPLPMHADVQLPMHHIQVDSKEPILTHNPGPPSKEPDKPPGADFKPSYGKSRDQGITKVESTAALFSIQPESHLTDCLALNPIPCPMSNEKNLSLVQNLFDDMEYAQSNLILETGSALRLWDEVLNGPCFQGDFHPLNTDLGKIESINVSDKELIDDVPPNLYDSLNFDYEYVSDPFEYPVIGQGLYIA